MPLTGAGPASGFLVMLSPGARQALAMAAGWVFAACCTALSFVYYEDVKSIARGLLSVTPAGTEAARGQGSVARVEQPWSAAGRIVELRASRNGHYYTSVEINGRPIDVMVDTGATMVALTSEDASRAGMYIRDRDYTQRVSTANGAARVAPVILDRVSVGTITVRNVPAAVSEPGMLATSLLGMSFLGRLQRVDMRSGVLVLSE